MNSTDEQGRKDVISVGEASVDVDNPWPGLLPFTEADRNYFQGRENETTDLFRFVMRERFVVFFGLSGLGKSSLLQAGLFPRVRDENIVPIYIRLDFSNAKTDLIAAVKAEVAHQCAAAGIEAPSARENESLWEYFHRTNNDFWNRRNRPVLPLLVFDQFEEVFTLGRLDSERNRAREILIEQLADLVEGRPPAALKAQIDEHPEEAREFTFVRHPYKILLAIREDFLAELEALRARIPAIALNRLRLRRMNGESALLVVNQAKHLIDPDVAEQVVRFVAADRRNLPLNEVEIEPALLSIVCRELNTLRKNHNEAKISSGLLEGNQEEVLNDFYERSVSNLPAGVTGFIEDHLLTPSGYRDSVAFENALNAPGVSRQVIGLLVERRLLRIEELDGVQRVELTHDLLTRVVRARRDQRRLLEVADEERRKLIASQERQRVAERARRLNWLVVASILIICVLAVISWTAYSSRRMAQEAFDSIKKGILIRQAAVAGRKEELQNLLLSLEPSPIQFHAEAFDQHYLNSDGKEVYEYDLFPTPESIESRKEGIALITYFLNHPTFPIEVFTVGADRQFRASYVGWGCLGSVPTVALIEYKDPEKPPSISEFNMCDVTTYLDRN